MNKDDIETLLKSLRDDTEGQPSASFRTNARIRILNQMAPTNVSHLSLNKRFWQFLSAAVAPPALPPPAPPLAAQGSAPQQLLYPIKIASEQAALLIAPDNNLKTTVANALIDRRARELEEALKEHNKNNYTYAAAETKQTIKSIKKSARVDQEKIDHHIALEPLIIKETENTKRIGDDEKHGSDRDKNKSNPPIGGSEIEFISPTINPEHPTESTPKPTSTPDVEGATAPEGRD